MFNEIYIISILRAALKYLFVGSDSNKNHHNIKLKYFEEENRILGVIISVWP